MRIRISTPIDQAARIVALFQNAFPGADVALVDGTTRESPHGADADYVVTGYSNDTLFERERRMKAIFAFSAGVAHLLSLRNLPRQVPLIRLEDAGMAPQMVRYVLAATLRFTQRLDVYACRQRERSWRQSPPAEPAYDCVGWQGTG